MAFTKSIPCFTLIRPPATFEGIETGALTALGAGGASSTLPHFKVNLGRGGTRPSRGDSGGM